MKKRVIAVFMSLCLLIGILGGLEIEKTAQAQTSADGLWEVSISDGAATITKYNGDAAEVIVPDTIDGVPVQYIGRFALNDLQNLKRIQFPDSVISMGIYVLAGCTSLTTVKLPKKLSVLPHDMFNGRTSLTEIIWPENLTEIGNGCFYNCSGLTGISIPDSVTKIGFDNFVGCSSLSAVHLPKNLKTIGTCVFAMNGIPLETVIFPEGTTSLGQHMFYSNHNIDYVVIPRSVTDFDYTGGTKSDLGFWGNGSSPLGAVYLCYKDSTAEQFAIKNNISYEIIGETYQVEGDYIYTIKEDDTAKIISYAGTDQKLLFPEKLGGKIVTEYGSIRKGRRNPNYHVTSLVLPKGMTSIGTEFQYYCCLTEITIPESVTEIQADAFVPYEEWLEEKPVIKGVAGSYAQTFAEENGYTFVPVSTEPITGPTANPTVNPTARPTVNPTAAPTIKPTVNPTAAPTIKPTVNPTVAPTARPTVNPTTAPTTVPTVNPTQEPEHTHVYKKDVQRASYLVDGSIRQVCSLCNEVKATEIIYCPKTILLSEDDYIYNDRVKTPKVKVKDRKGALLKANRDYRVVYGAGRKNPGKYKVTIEFLGNYRSKVTKTFTIRPKETKLKKLKAKSKGFQAAWKKNRKQTDGYQLQYCTGGNFTKKKTKTVQIKKNTTVKKKITGLKKKKKYYVRIRTYKKVIVDGVGKTLYSDWSNTKTVKTKK